MDLVYHTDMTRGEKVLLVIGVVGLALVVVELARGQTQIGPQQMKAVKAVVLTCALPAVAPVTVTNPDGTTTTTPGSNCAGMYYLDVVTAGGAEVKLIGVPPLAGFAFDPSGWNAVP
jgi:hypothetical protein